MLAKAKKDWAGECDPRIWPAYVWRGASVFVPNGIRKCVVFLGIKKQGRFYPRATAFFASSEDQGFWFPFLVTAEHVVSALLLKNEQIYVRVNLQKGGAEEHPIPAASWFFHPDPSQQTDVAVCWFEPLGTDMDITATPLEKPYIASEEIMDGYNIGPGDEVAIIGLFRSHYGLQKNTPVVRIGNIAAIADEPVETTYCGFIEAHLIEARSIGGLSGSPVFLSLQQQRNIVGTPNSSVERPYYLFGLMHGHFDIKDLNMDVVTDAETEALGAINTGMGVVVPVKKIVETVNQPEVLELRRRLIAEAKSGGATADVFDDDLPANGENPTHREDFMRLVGAAARKPA